MQKRYFQIRLYLYTHIEAKTLLSALKTATLKVEAKTLLLKTPRWFVQ